MILRVWEDANFPVLIWIFSLLNGKADFGINLYEGNDELCGVAFCVRTSDRLCHF